MAWLSAFRAGTGRSLGNRAVAVGFLALMLVVACLALTAKPAHASTFTVNSVRDIRDADLTDNVCDTQELQFVAECTLRAAIEEANDTPGTDTINFNISGSGIQTISPATDLPDIADPVVIDGYTQPGTKVNTKAQGSDAILSIVLDGSSSTGIHGLDITASNSVVKGLVISKFRSGVWIFGAGNRLEGNFIGTDANADTAQPNIFNGVSIYGKNNTVGGTMPAARNVISGNGAEGVYIETSADAESSGNKILGNLIGTKRDGTSDLGNPLGGVEIFGASNNTVGGTDSSAANTIAFNGQDVHNGGDGVKVRTKIDYLNRVFVPTGNRILRNSIFSNGSTDSGDMGIDFVDLGDSIRGGRTPNDDKDPDVGPNNLQNFPTLTSAKSSRRTTIKGTLNSTPKKTFIIQFFSNPPGTDEGQIFIGQKSVTTDSGGNASFTFRTRKRVLAGQEMTATATDAGGNTSEFSDKTTVVQS